MTFSVSGITNSLSDISLSMTMTHTWVGDLDVVLAPPGVTPGNPGSFVIYSRVGATTGGGAGAGDSSNLNGTYVFEDAAASNFWTAAASVGDTASIPSGGYRTSLPGPTTAPAANTSLLAAFGALTPAQINGTWTLRFRDGWVDFAGSVSAAALTLLDVPTPPTITSTNNTTFTEVTPSSFTVTATGSTPISFSVSGSLPAGVSFDGSTGILSGTPALGSSGVYPLVFTATNGTSPNATQSFSLAVVDPPAGSATIYTYENTTPLAIPDDSCPTGVTRTFDVTESFNVGGFGSIALGIELAHTSRGQLEIILQAPNGATQVLQDSVGGTENNLNVTYTSNADSGNTLDDGDLDTLAIAGGTTFYRRLAAVGGLDSFYSGPANGTWTLRICDNTAGTSGTLQRAQLILADAAAPAPQICTNNSTFDWAANGNNATFSSVSVAPDNVLLSEVSNSGDAIADGGDGVPSFRTRTTTQGAHPGYYVLQMDTSGDTEITAETVLFDFDTPVSGLSFALLDVDRGAPSSWEDYVKVTANGPQGRVPYYVSLDNTVNLNLAGDWVETDVSADPATTGGNVTYTFLGPVDEVRIQYAQGNEPNANSVFQIIGVTDFSFCTYDYADGPASYGTLAADNGPRHGLQNRDTLFLGAAPPDGETEGLVSAGATLDDASLNNDETGAVSFPPARLNNQGWVCGTYTTDPSTNEYCVIVTVTNNSGTPAQLVGWIDFNNNGVFDPGERSLPELQSIATTGFTTGNIPNGSNSFQAVLVFDPGVPVPSNETPSMIRLRLTTDTLFFSDATPPSHLGIVSDGEVQDHAIPIGTLPVTLAAFSAVRLDGERLAVRWSVATEAGTLGYRVLQATARGGVEALSGELIPASGVDALTPQHYEAIMLSSSDAPLYLEEVASKSKPERFGPFVVGTASGDTLLFEAAPWSQAAAEVAASRSAEDRSRLQRGGGPGAEILVDAAGLQRVAISDLQAIGVDFSGHDPFALALTAGERSVPFRVDPPGTLGAASVIEFVGEPVTDSLYTRTRPYLLRVGPSSTRWEQRSGAPQSALASEVIRHRFALDEDREYSFSAPDDPWYYDSVQRNGAVAGKNWTLQVPRAVPAASMLDIELWGGLDYPNAGLDHRYRVSLNGVVLGERSFDGVRSDRVRYTLAPGLVRDGANVVRIELLDTGFARDLVRVESIAIETSVGVQALQTATGIAAGALVATPDVITLASFETVEPAPECGDACAQLLIGGLPDSDVLALHMVNDRVTELTDPLVVTDGAAFAALVRFGELQPQGDNGGGSGERLLVLSRSQAQVPAVRPAAPVSDPLIGGAAELVVIAPYRFMAAVDPLVQARRAEGMTVRVINVADLYQHYSGGVTDPLAIKRFLQRAYAELGTRYVLLAGGDTYDALDRLRLGSISDVPTLYGRTHPVVAHAPLDGLFADLNDDGSPELAIGRLPARTLDEMQAMVAKILAPRPTGPVVLAAERSNAAEAADYATELDGVIGLLPLPAQASTQRIYLDQYPAGSNGVAAARADLVTAVNAGASVVGYYGHGSPTIWSREQLLQSAQLPGLLQNTQMPVVTEFGCWGGYFVAPEYSSMSHGWLAHDSGASAYLGSSGLTEHASDRRMAELLLPALLQPGVRVGEALRQAKQQLMAIEPEYADIIRGLSLFGDPTMQMSSD